MPGTSGVVGEFLFFCGAFQSNTWVAFFAATGVILGAAYMLYLYRRVVFGPLVRDDLKNIADLSRREIAIMVPLVVMVMRSEEHTSELQSLMRISYAVFCLKKKKQIYIHKEHI